MPKVSIIIPIYNSAEYLKACMDSIVKQTLKDIEIICINDGSTDNSEKIIQQYAKKDKRIIYIKQENQGLSITRNNGIKLATGDYIGFVDSDDTVSLNFFEELYNLAHATNADVAYCSLATVRNNETKIVYDVQDVDVFYCTEEKYEVANIPYNCHVVNKLYKRKFLLKTGILFEPKVFYEDMEFTHKVLHNSNKLVTVPNSVYYYYERSTSIVNRKTKENEIQLDKARYKSLKYVLDNGINIKDWTAYYSSNCFHICKLTVNKYDDKYMFFYKNKPLTKTIEAHSEINQNKTKNTKIPKIIHYVWLGGKKKPKLVQDCIKSWKKYCPDYKIIEWNESVFTEINNQYLTEAYNSKKYAFASDYIRLWALKKYGGIYLDTDAELTNSLNKFLIHSFFMGQELHNNVVHLNTALIGAEPNNKIVSELLNLYDNKRFIKDDGEFDLTPNPVLFLNFFTQHYKTVKIQNGFNTINITNNAVIYPYHYFCIPAKFHINYAIHHFSGSWVGKKHKTHKLMFDKIIKWLFAFDKDSKSHYVQIIGMKIRTKK